MAVKITQAKTLWQRFATQFLVSSRNLTATTTTESVAPEFSTIKTNFTSDLKFVNRESYDPIPIYRILGSEKENEAIATIKMEKEKFKKMYEGMLTIGIMDKILYESQRQGRISFYITNTGEEAVQIASAAALSLNDIVYAQYREAGVLLWRGFNFNEFMNQCYGNHEDIGKGKQMPIHYGSKMLNFVTISSPLTTQLPQAVGAAYALKRSRSNQCVVVYFGEGAASEGDAHAALNFAATLDCPIIFLCRNNGYAISTPAHEQYRGDGIAAKGPAYGINTIRVDGNDVFAMYKATQTARDWVLTMGKPVLIEAMTYRVGHHSTSDDSSAYRSPNEVMEWEQLSPVQRFRPFLEKVGLWSTSNETDFKTSMRKQLLAELAEAEKKLKPDWKELFTDVYSEIPKHIKKQMTVMKHHLEEYQSHYPLDRFKQG